MSPDPTTETSGNQKSPNQSDTPKSQAYTFSFEHSQFASKINRVISHHLSKTSPMTASMWQYFLILCNYQDCDYWAQSVTPRLRSPHKAPNAETDNKTERQIGSYSKANQSQLLLNKIHLQHSTCAEKLFQQVSIAIHCESTATRQQLDNSTSLTMLLMNQLVELFALASYEPTVLDLFGTIHRNAAASSLFIHCINSHWMRIMNRRSLGLLYACLKSVEAVHLGSFESR
jgi:hypothetical protein